jgi:hypothetical protein
VYVSDLDSGISEDGHHGQNMLKYYVLLYVCTFKLCVDGQNKSKTEIWIHTATGCLP